MIKTTFDKAVRDELIARIEKLGKNSQPLWGKMNVYQMVKHCTLWEEMASGQKKYRLVLLGRLFGRIALKKTVGNDLPMKRNLPTVAAFRVKAQGDVEAEKARWIALLQGHAHFTDEGILHPFFGHITKEQIGIIAYKHIDHHLRQFNC